MKVSINKQEDVKKFANIFKHIGTLQEFFKLNFTPNGVTGQAMDSAHICLFELNLVADWFGEYEVETEINMGVASILFCKMIECLKDDQTITIRIEDGEDRVSIDLVGDKSINKYFELALIDLDVEFVTIPVTEYDADIELKSELFAELVDEFTLFNDVLNMKCNDEYINMTANGDSGKMAVKINDDDIIEYAIEEDSEVQLSFSLPYFHKMCMFRKLAPTLSLHLSTDTHMKLQYKLGDNTEDDPNYLQFFLAPKIDDM